MNVLFLFIPYMHEGMGTCGCMHHKAGPLAIVLIGLVFLLQALGVMAAATVAVVWPVLLILFGLQKMMGGSMCGCCGRGKM